MTPASADPATGGECAAQAAPETGRPIRDPSAGHDHGRLITMTPSTPPTTTTTRATRCARPTPNGAPASTRMQYQVARHAATERAFTGKYWDHFDDGRYLLRGLRHAAVRVAAPSSTPAAAGPATGSRSTARWSNASSTTATAWCASRCAATTAAATSATSSRTAPSPPASASASIRRPSTSSRSRNDGRARSRPGCAPRWRRRGCEVQDDSHLHAGHAGAREGRHFTVRIASARFAGLSRVARHRLVYDALGPLGAQGVHALAIVARGPGRRLNLAAAARTRSGLARQPPPVRPHS